MVKVYLNKAVIKILKKIEYCLAQCKCPINVKPLLVVILLSLLLLGHPMA